MNPYFLASDIINWLNLQVGQRDLSSWAEWRTYITKVLHEDSVEAFKMRVRFSQSVAKARKYTLQSLTEELNSLNEMNVLLVKQGMNASSKRIPCF